MKYCANFTLPNTLPNCQPFRWDAQYFQMPMEPHDLGVHVFYLAIIWETDLQPLATASKHHPIRLDLMHQGVFDLSRLFRLPPGRGKISLSHLPAEIYTKTGTLTQCCSSLSTRPACQPFWGSHRILPIQPCPIPNARRGGSLCPYRSSKPPAYLGVVTNKWQVHETLHQMQASKE